MPLSALWRPVAGILPNLLAGTRSYAIAVPLPEAPRPDGRGASLCSPQADASVDYGWKLQGLGVNSAPKPLWRIDPQWPGCTLSYATSLRLDYLVG